MPLQTEKDILSELNTFLNGASQPVKSNSLDLSKIALNLLKTLPTSRDAILEYFCTVFDLAVSNYIVRIETEIATGEMPQTCSREEATVSEIHAVLCNFVTGNAPAWAPIISTWSLELLGELSSRYAGRAHVSISAGLNETLQLWMGCRSTRTLIDITTQCLTGLMDSDSETWMNALLDTSVKHSPHFDWVVAHVGSCFPNTVITRVLSCGLKDFCQHKSVDTGRKAPKLASVVGILGHLAGSHFGDIRTALLQLFKWSLQPYNLLDTEIKSQKMATGPFLLQLASMSPTLLNAMATNIRHTLKSNVITRLYTYIAEWCKYFGSPKVLQDLVVKLILDCEVDAIQIVNLLLEQTLIAEQEENIGHVREIFREILEYVLAEIDQITRNTDGPVPIKFVHSLVKDISELHVLALRPARFEYEIAVRLIILIAKNNVGIGIRSACFILQSAHSPEHLAMLVKLVFSVSMNSKLDFNFGHTDTFAQVLKQTLLETSNYDLKSAEQFWRNLLHLLKWEKCRQVPMLESGMISKAIILNMMHVSNELADGGRNEQKVRHIIAEIVYVTVVFNGDTSTPLEFSAHLMFSLINSLVTYLFTCCSEQNRVLKMKAHKIVCELFATFSTQSKPARVIALRELLERSVFRKESLLFGAEMKDKTDADHCKELLLYKNHKHSTTMMLTRHSSVFHSGIIGDGKRKPKALNCERKDLIAENIELLLLVVKSCCYDRNGEQSLTKSPMSLDALTLVSLLLVQFVSPDVMYNGLPWPEEEFSKVTIERDLYIRRLFSKVPILWHFLRLVAVYRPVLCYCSVLLRALFATMLHQWSSISGGDAQLLNLTIRLLDVMSLGQLLPPPLANIQDILPYLSNAEVVQVLRNCIWNYMRDHVPSPALFGCDPSGLHWRDPTAARPPPPYTETLRTFMYKNIDKTGVLYAQLFVNVPENTEQ